MGRVGVAAGVVSVEDGGEAFLLDTRSRRYYRLNEAGLAVWQALELAGDPLGALRERYPSVDHDVLAGDLEGILRQLGEAGLVQRSTTG